MNSYTSGHLYWGADGYNRYMVECECIRTSVTVVCLAVLIDTWWNVNITHSSHRYLVSGFNRYMVECELSLFLYISDSFSRFNRYMVECEFFDIIKCTLTYTVLIDTWWNVNFFCKRIYGR